MNSVVATKISKALALLWAGWIFMSSSLVITRFQFAEFACRTFNTTSDAARQAFESSWWIIDRLYRNLEFGIMAALLLAAFPKFQRRPMLLMLTTFGLAIMDEYHQFLVNAPAAHLYDIFIDQLGPAIVLWVYIGVQIKRESVALEIS